MSASREPGAGLVFWLMTACIGALGLSMWAASSGPPSVPAWALRALLLAAPLGAMAVAVGLVDRVAAKLAPRHWRMTTRKMCTLVLGVALGGAATWFVGFETSVPFNTTRGIGIAACAGGAALAGALVFGAALARLRPLERLGADRIGALALPPLAVGVYMAGRSLELSPYWPIHDLHPFFEALLCVIAVAFVRRAGWVGSKTAWAGALTLGFALCLVMATPPFELHRAYGRVMFRTGPSRRVLHLLRALTDFDGDGYSARFDGGDCDDRDPDAFPLGPIDCDGFAGAPPAPAPAPPSLPPVDRVLVLTIDTWRCHLDGRPLCPDLDRVAPAPSYHGQQRVYMGQTKRSLGVLFGAPFVRSGAEADARPAYLIVRARAAGFRTKAFIPLPFLRGPANAGLFDEIEETDLGASSLERVHSGALARRVAEDLAASGPDARRFVWAHFLDPHAPYIATAEGDAPPLLFTDQRDSYVAEVLRTQANVASLVERARALGFGRRAAIVVTGDHGESFAHGYRFHGTSSYEGELTTPIYVWLFDDAGQVVPLKLPPTVAEREVAALLAALVGAPPPPDQSAVSFTDAKDGDEQLAVVEYPWKLVYHVQARYAELYDLAADPDEQHDFAEERTEVVWRLTRRLAAELGPLLKGSRPYAR